MSTLTITLSSWQSIGSATVTAGAQPGDALTGTATIVPSLTSGGVLGPGLAVPARETVAIGSLPWSYDLLDPTTANPSGWGYTIYLQAAGQSPVPVVLSSASIASLTQTSGVRTAALEDYVGLSNTLGTGGLVAAVPGPAGPAGTGSPKGWFDVTAYGAVGDDSTDCTTPIQNAIKAIKATSSTAASGSNGGNVLYFPPGYYLCTSALDFQGLTEVRILGGAGRGLFVTPDDNPPCAIVSHASGTAPAVDMRGSQACVWDGVSIISRNASFTGDLLSLDSLTSTPIVGHRIQNCTLYTIEGLPAALLSMAGCIETSIVNVNFRDATTTQVRMVTPTAPAAWSNANSFISCTFTGPRTYSVLNPGPQTTWVDCTFEANPTGNVPAPIEINALGSEQCTGLTWIGCGFWDNTASTGSWVQSSVATSAWTVTGGKWSVSASAFSLSAHTGLAISGVRFDGPSGVASTVFDPAYTITNGSMLGCYVSSPVVDNHASVWPTPAAGASGWTPDNPIAGGYIRLPVAAGSQTGTFAMTVGLAYAVPLQWPTSYKLSTVGVAPWSAPAGACVTRLGVYKDTGTGYPGALILDAGTVDCDGTLNALEMLNVLTTLAAGAYWIVAVGQGANAPSLLGSAASLLQSPVVGTSGSSVAGQGWQSLTVSGITGALPATFPTGGAPTLGSPHIFIGG